MKLYLVRHALPGQQGYDNRFPGPGLGSLGRKQAAWIGEFLSNKELTSIWSSDFIRTMETAKEIQLHFPHLQIRKDKRLRERQAEEETHESLARRVKEWCLENLEQINSQSVAVVGHGGSLNMILNFLDPGYQKFNYPYINEFQVRTPIAGIWEIDLHRDSAKLNTCPTQT
ncbi:MAG: histidine phosphatase family protein [Bacteroidia bacterium]|nr:histidine phosphatase family protein [Bacteroidia bacterium]